MGYVSTVSSCSYNGLYRQRKVRAGADRNHAWMPDTDATMYRLSSATLARACQVSRVGYTKQPCIVAG